MTSPISGPIETLLTSEPLMAHLATCANGRPHVAPVWYVYDEGVVSIVTAGKKLKNIRQNPRVSVSVEQSTDGNPEWTVTLLGTADIIEDEEAFRETNRRINHKYGASADAFPQNTLVRIAIASASHRTY